MISATRTPPELATQPAARRPAIASGTVRRWTPGSSVPAVPAIDSQSIAARRSCSSPPAAIRTGKPSALGATITNASCGSAAASAARARSAICSVLAHTRSASEGRASMSNLDSVSASPTNGAGAAGASGRLRRYHARGPPCPGCARWRMRSHASGGIVLGTAMTRPVGRSGLPARAGRSAAPMPKTFNGAVELYWESSGAGPPVLLIAGQGMTLDAWWRTAQTLERSFRVVTFDNRDVGRSSHLPWPYGVPQMVDDAVAVLDAARIARAHVYGISLGGMIAQELALCHPQRVGALVLGATTPGGPNAVLARSEPLTFFVRVGAMAPEEAEWAAVPYNYSLRTRRRHGDRIAADIARRIAHQTDSLAYLHQVAAAAGPRG